MNKDEMLRYMLKNLDDVLLQRTAHAKQVWDEFLKLHPADIAQFLVDCERSVSAKVFLAIPEKVRVEIFQYLSDAMKVFVLSRLSEIDRRSILTNLSLDEITDLFDELSDEELKRYLSLLHKKSRAQVIALLKFDSDSAGGIMHTSVLTLMKDFTIEQSIKILQRLQPKKELHRNLYVTDQENKLVGYITLEDLVLQPPKTRIQSILKIDPYVVDVNVDKEEVAQQMRHYKIMDAPVISPDKTFLGIIPSEELVDVLEQEAAEDVYKISAVTPIKYSYFETPFWRLFYQRGWILSVLLLMQTFSQIIISHYEDLLKVFGLVSFISMIASTGGNSSSQTSALVLQGMVSGEITDKNMYRFLKREFLMAMCIGFTLGLVSFLRVALTQQANLLGNLAVSLSLAVIVLVSVMLGSFMPIILKKLRLDPAMAAGPVLATLMDVLGIYIYCYISSLILN